MKHSKLKSSLFVALLFINSLAYGQSAELSRLVLSEETWLPRRTINCIFQDSRSFLWIGAVSGLYRYDGYEVLHFTTQPDDKHAIFTNTVRSIQELKDGNLLIATESGLSIFDVKTHYFSTISNVIENFTTTTQDLRGNTWVSVDNKNLLYSLKPGFNNKSPLKPYFENQESVFQRIGSIKAMCPLALDLLLIGTEKGLFVLSTKSGEIKETEVSGSITTICKSDEGEIMVGTKDDGLFELSFEKNKIKIQNHYHFGKPGETAYDKISSVSAGKNGRYFVSTLNGAYISVNNRSVGEFLPFNSDSDLFLDNNILTSYIDNSGIIWIGTLKGLLKIRRRAISVERFKIGTPNYRPINHSVTYLFKDFANKIWVNTLSDGIFVFDPLTSRFSKKQLPKEIERMYQSVNGKMYFVSLAGMFEESKGILSKVYSSKSELGPAIELEKGEWLLGCRYKGLEYYSENNTGLYTKIVEKANRFFNYDSGVFVMEKDNSQNLWIGSRGDGLMRINLNSGLIKKYSGIDGSEEIISRRILYIYEDSRNRVWIGSRTGGLYRYIPETDSFIQYTVKHGLPSNVVCAIAEDKNNKLLVSTNNGLAVFVPNEPIPFQSFGVEDGIDFTDFTFNSVAKGPSGDVYFGNTNGLYRVNPIPNISRRNAAFFWNSVKILGKDTETSYRIGKDNKVNLASSENSFEVSFSFTDLSNPIKNRFAYRLNGSNNDEWTYNNTSEQKIQLLSIPFGKYELELKTANSYGQWNNEPIKLKLTIAPPFYRSNLAWLIYFCLLFFLVYLLYLVFRNWQNLNTRLSEEKAYGAMKDQQMVYFSDLSHELKNRLTLILGPLENALSGKKVNQGVLANLYEQAQRLKRITDQIMNLRKNEGGEFVLQVSKGNLTEKLNAICRDTEPLALIRDIKLEYTFDKSMSDVWFDKELLEIMLLNLLSNAIKYNTAKGTVSVKGGLSILNKSDLTDRAPNAGTYLECQVRDSGVGIPEDEVKHLFERFYRASNTKNSREGAGIGLELVTRLIEKHKGFIDIQSELNKGTQITFFIPLEKDHFQINEMKISMDSTAIIEVDPKPKESIFVQKPTVLLVDDEPEILDLLEETLIDEFGITRANNGQEALELLSVKRFELVISDLSMPRLDGLALLRNVKENSEWNHIPFIILTGRNSEFHKLICVQSGVDDFIDKPFSPDLIKWQAKNLIKNRNLLENKFSKKIAVTPDETTIVQPEEEFLQKVIGLIEEYIVDPKLGVEFLAEECNMSRATFYRKIENILGESPSEFIRTYRLKKATQLLKNTNLYISEIAYQTGFKSPKYFTRIFQKKFGVTPTDYLKNIKNEPVNYGHVNSEE